MVQLRGGALGLVVDTRGVQLEGVVAGINGNRHRLLNNGGLEGTLRSGGNVRKSRDGSTNVGSCKSAFSLDSLIRVALLSVNTTVLDDVLESIVHQTTIATLVSVAVRAIHQVLLREGNKVSGRNLVETLGGTGGREGPAITTLSLVLNGSHSALGHPVDGSRGINFGGLEDSRGLGNVGSEVSASVLLIANISEQVKPELGLVVDCIPLLDIIHVALEDSVSSLEFLHGVEPLVGLHPVGELILILLLREAACTSSQQGNHKQQLGLHFW